MFLDLLDFVAHVVVSSMLPDLSKYFDECNVINRNDEQNYDMKTQVVINQNYPPKGLVFSLHVQFAGFSSESLCERIMDAQSSVLVTAGGSGSTRM